MIPENNIYWFGYKVGNTIIKLVKVGKANNGSITMESAYITLKQ